jgi:hypothetical protein
MFEMDNMKRLKYEKLPRSLICFNRSPLSSTKNVQRRVPVLVTRLAPENAPISTTSSTSSVSPPLEPGRCVDAWWCVSWLPYKGVEDGEVNNLAAI